MRTGFCHFPARFPAQRTGVAPDSAEFSGSVQGNGWNPRGDRTIACTEFAETVDGRAGRD
jgi:hypothetical protein